MGFGISSLWIVGDFERGAIRDVIDDGVLRNGAFVELEKCQASSSRDSTSSP